MICAGCSSGVGGYAQSVTDNSEQARQAEAAWEKGVSIVREVQQFIEQARGADAGGVQGLPSLVRQVSEAMDLEMADIIAAVGKLGGLSGTAASTSYASGNLGAVAAAHASGSLALAKPRIVAFGDVGTATDGLSVVKLEDIAELTTRAKRDGIAGLSKNQIFLLAVVLVLSVSLVAIVPDLSPEAQAELGTDLGIISLALALVAMVARNRER